MHHFKNRNELKAKIEELGGKVSGSVSSKTSYLINNDVTSVTNKNKKAKDLGIPIISEDDFLKMIKKSHIYTLFMHLLFSFFLYFKSRD